VTDARITVRYGVEKKMAGGSRDKGGDGSAGEGVSQKHPDGNVDRGKHENQLTGNFQAWAEASFIN